MEKLILINFYIIPVSSNNIINYIINYYTNTEFHFTTLIQDAFVSSCIIP